MSFLTCFDEIWQISIDGTCLGVMPGDDDEDGARTELVTASVAAALDDGSGPGGDGAGPGDDDEL